jgi:hypothetical protein
MKTERYKGGYRLFLVVLILLIGLIVNGYVNDAIPSVENLKLLALLGFFILSLVYFSTLNTYLEIQDERTLVNSGYHDFGKDIIAIHDIKYIYRVPQFIVAWYGGSLMVIYHKDTQNGIQHSALRERNYNQDTLKRFLLRIKEIKPTIEIDSEYQEFLKGNLELRSPSKNKVEQVEQRLRDRGERWERASRMSSFLGR